MTRYFITGSTGLIGLALTRKLTESGCAMNLLVRSARKADSLVSDGISVFEGDVTDYTSVEKAMYGCTHVFHLAAFAKPYAKDPEIFDRVNVEGTRNVLEAALKNKIRKVVYTSTAGVFEITGPDDDANESSVKPEEYYTDYIRTKRAAEMVCGDYARKGLDIITTYPTRVFGPGIISDSNGIVRILKLYDKGRWRIIPGDGQTFGNYVYVGDVAGGLIKAMDHGKPGESYILGGENLSFNDLFQIMGAVTQKDYTLFHLPYPLLWTVTSLMVVVSRFLHKKVIISPGWVHRYLHHRRMSSQKALDEINYEITPVREGLKKTLEWLNQK